MTKWHDDDHMERSINNVFDILMKRFNKEDKEGLHIDDLAKISSQIGYMAQVKTGMEKNIAIQKEIKDIKSYLKRIPPEMLAELNQPATLEANASLR